MTRYNAQPIAERLKTMGSIAEQKFRQWARLRGISFADFGLRGPEFNYAPGLPLPIRKAPDFICEYQGRHAFFDCKGTGRDGIVKIRTDAVEGMRWWDTLVPLHVFVYDSAREHISYLPLTELEGLIDPEDTGVFPRDKHRYYRIGIDRFRWQPAP